MSKIIKIHIINGPNLNLTGMREPGIYGQKSLDEIMALTRNHNYGTNVDITEFQSNCEGALIDDIQKKRKKADFIVINAGGYTHTSVALRDALVAAETPFCEVHISNVFAREEFRHKSMLADKAVSVISGGGEMTYILGIIAGISYLKQNLK